ncbi:MAG: hypothetical protein ACE5IL_12605, partial [Myxococcota bacterium]
MQASLASRWTSSRRTQLAGLLARILASDLSLADSASAVSLQATLSGYSSDETRRPAAPLDAMFQYTLSGSSLTVNVMNLTDSATGYDIDRFYLHMAAGVTGLSLDSIDESPSIAPWSLAAGKGAKPFGTFAWRLTGKTGGSSTFIDGGQSVLFGFTISGATSDADLFALTAGGSLAVGAAARFRDPVTGAKAFGASATV